MRVGIKRVILGLLSVAVAPFMMVPAAANANVVWYYPWGQCTWYADQVRPDIGRRIWGNAKEWSVNAQRAGMRVGDTPQVASIAVFQPGVDGAAWTGHVAQVVWVAPNGHFSILETNAPILGRITHRADIAPGPGVKFIYG